MRRDRYLAPRTKLGQDSVQNSLDTRPSFSQLGSGLKLDFAVSPGHWGLVTLAPSSSLPALCCGSMMPESALIAESDRRSPRVPST